jgi:bifunctional non-homologous end joining protein LigD
MSPVPFIPPALPRLKASPPSGEDWLYELKFDGYRVQLHKAGLSSRSTAGTAATSHVPTKSCIIDGELIAAGKRGEPNFLALLYGRYVPVCV